MFVQSNTVKAIKDYFQKKLSDQFSETEIRLISNESLKKKLGLSTGELMLSNETLLSESELLYFRSIVKRLLNKEPFQYVLGETHFYGLDLACDKRALIPRPETEELVEWMKDTFQNSDNLKMMDLCTGSGCIALALKSVFKNSSICGSDISKDAIDLATENKQRTNLDVTFIQFDALNESHYSNFEENSFDTWVSNPPYIPNDDKERMEQNVLDFEPHLALFVENEDPLLFYRVIANQANVYLKSKGYLFYEIHEDLSDETIQLLEKLNFVNIEVRKDLQGKNRMLKAQKR